MASSQILQDITEDPLAEEEEAEEAKIKEHENNLEKVALEITNVAKGLLGQPKKELKIKMIELKKIIDQLILLL